MVKVITLISVLFVVSTAVAEPSPAMIRNISTTLWLGSGFFGGFADASRWEAYGNEFYHGNWNRGNFHTWDGLSIICTCSATSTLTWGLARKITTPKQTAIWLVGQLFIRKVTYELSYRWRMYGSPKWVDQDDYWRMIGLDDTKAMDWIRQSELSEAVFIAVSEVVMTSIGLKLLNWGDKFGLGNPRVVVECRRIEIVFAWDPD